MIMKASSSRSVGWGGKLLWFATAFAVLPFSPTWAQKPEIPRIRVDVAAAAPAVVAEPEISDDLLLFTVDASRGAPQDTIEQGGETKTDVAGDLRESIRRLEKELDEARAKKEDIRARVLEQVLDHLRSALAHQNEPASRGRGRARIEIRRHEEGKADEKERAETKEAREKAHAEVNELAGLVKKRSEEMREAGERLREAQQKLAEASRKLALAEGRIARAVTARVFRVAPDDGRDVVEFSTPRVPGMPVPPVPPFPMSPRAGMPGGFPGRLEKRLADLEKQLGEVMERLETLGKKSSDAKPRR